MKFYNILFLLSCFCVSSLSVPLALAQAANKNEEDILASSGRDMTLVIGAGAAGSILGLSTLSFVDRPKDHLKNILVGGSIGIIIGVAFVAWNQANATQSYFPDEKQKKASHRREGSPMQGVQISYFEQREKDLPEIRSKPYFSVSFSI